MKFTSAISRAIKQEGMYQVFSKNHLVVLLITLILLSFHANMLRTAVIDNYDMYLRTKASYLERGQDVDDALKEKYEISQNQSGMTEITNPLNYDLVNLAISIQNLDLRNFISASFEYFTFVFGTYIFAMLGIYLATYEKAHKTIKLKANLKNIQYMYMAKMLMLFLYSVAVVIVMVVFALIVSPILKETLMASYPLSEFYSQTIAFEVSVWLQGLFCVGVFFLFGHLGLTLGTIFAKPILPSVLSTLFLFIVPIFSMYDVRNVVSIFSHRIFYFYGKFSLFTPIGGDLNFALVYVFALSCILVVINVVTLKRRSLYS